MNIATIGTGNIVGAFMRAIDLVPGVHCIAMYSRQEETARLLAEKHSILEIYTDFEKILESDSIDTVYIASPNSLHYEQALKALKSGKHVICEKPFTSTVKELDHLIETAKANHLMLFEAITTIHLPNYQLVKENIDKVGKIQFVQCNYSQYSSKYDSLLSGETPNVFNLEFSGGALTDINLYNLYFVVNLFGQPEQVHYFANKHENGIDTSGVVVLEYPDFLSQCVGAKDSNSKNFALIQGEKGYIHVVDGANGCKQIELVLNDGSNFLLNAQTVSNRLYYELAEFSTIFLEEDYDRCYQLLESNRTLLKVVESARKDANIVFKADDVQLA